MACIASRTLMISPNIMLGVGFGLSVYNPNDKFSKERGQEEELAEHRLLDVQCDCYDENYVGLVLGNQNIKGQTLHAVYENKALPSRSARPPRTNWVH